MDPHLPTVTPPSTNFLHRDSYQNKLDELIEQEKFRQEMRSKQNHSHLLIVIIGLLLFTNICAVGYIGILSTQIQSTAAKTLAHDINPAQVGLNNDAQGQQAGMVTSETQLNAGLASQGNNLGLSNEQMKALNDQAIQKVQEMKNSGQSNIFTKSLDMANDAKRQADLNNITTALNIYYLDHEELPNNFPNTPKCIGTDPTCFDLYTLLVPQYMDKPIMDPKMGTTGNTGYLVGQSHNGIATFTAQGTGENGDIITVEK